MYKREGARKPYPNCCKRILTILNLTISLRWMSEYRDRNTASALMNAQLDNEKGAVVSWRAFDTPHGRGTRVKGARAI